MIHVTAQPRLALNLPTFQDHVEGLGTQPAHPTPRDPDVLDLSWGPGSHIPSRHHPRDADAACQGASL